MTDLQEVDAPHLPGQPAFHRQPRVGLEQEPHRAVPHPQHHAVVVHIERQPEPERVGAQYLEHHTVHLDPVSRPRPVPPRARCLDTREKLEIQGPSQRDRKSTRLNSSHSQISYAVFCLKKKNKTVADGIITTSKAIDPRLTIIGTRSFSRN